MSKIQTSHIWYKIFAIAFLLINIGKAANIKLTNLKCTGLSESLGKFEICNMKAVKRDVVELNVYYAMAIKNVDNATAVVRLKKRGDMLAQSALYQMKVDVCAFFRNTRRNPLANLLYSAFEFEKYSNINHSCPYSNNILDLSICISNYTTKVGSRSEYHYDNAKSKGHFYNFCDAIGYGVENNFANKILFVPYTQRKAAT